MKKPEPTLTKRAAFTLISNLLGQAARFIITFFITPIVVNGLGKELYGLWTIIQQVIGYFSLSDLRPSGTLKFLLGIKQHNTDLSEKNRLVGSTLLLWGISLPVMVIAGTITVYFAPNLIQTPQRYVFDVQVALAIMILSAVLDRVLSIPANFLRGQNLEYKGMLINMISILLAGALNVAAIWGGWGLPGLAFTSFVGIFVSSGFRFYVARQAIPWMSIEKPRVPEFKNFAKTSAWLSFSSLSSLLLNSSDTLIIGAMIGPSASAVYMTTEAVVRMFSDSLNTILGSGNPGIAGLCGQKEWQRVSQVRKEMHVLVLATMAIIGSGVLALNSVFLNLWVNQGYFGGTMLNTILVLATLVTLISRIDTPILISIMYYREQTWISLVAGIATVATGALLIPLMKETGMAIGMLVGQIVVLIPTWYIFSSKIGLHLGDYFATMLRPIIATTLLFGAGLAIEPFVISTTWFSFALWSIAIGIIAALFMWFAGLNNDMRKGFIHRFLHSSNLESLRRK